eukprot:m.141844 g.141844  ORF g.141844 m.141844 type:complete len:380 (+) comp14044_c0_seq4:1339-2478(+)
MLHVRTQTTFPTVCMQSIDIQHKTTNFFFSFVFSLQSKFSQHKMMRGITTSVRAGVARASCISGYAKGVKAGAPSRVLQAVATRCFGSITRASAAATWSSTPLLATVLKHANLLVASGVVGIGCTLAWYEMCNCPSTAMIIECEAAVGELSMQELEQAAEAMYHQNQLGVYEFLRSEIARQDASAGVLWRFARACRDHISHSKDKQHTKALTYEGMAAVERALELDDNDFAVHKWMAIMLSCKGDVEGNKAKLLNAYKMKEHFVRATELNPTDATSRHLLGVWCFTFADMPWYQRKAAAAIFATPPQSTYQEALDQFLAAEQLDPNFYTKNTLYIGKTYYGMGNKALAREWLDKCLTMKANNPDDEEALAEAKKLRGKL